MTVTCVGLAPAPPGLGLHVGAGGQEGGVGAVLSVLSILLGTDLDVLSVLTLVHLKQDPQQSAICQTRKPESR